MTIALVFNPGSNSLKFELVKLAESQTVASDATKLADASIDEIGKEDSKISVYASETETTPIDAKDMTAAVEQALEWLRSRPEHKAHLQAANFVGVRVVHGGNKFTGAVRFTDDVRQEIEALEELAPLHNKSSLEILDVLARELPDVPAFVTFDTAFHRTLPEVAWRYAIERETADRHGIRKCGFHGVSHRYMLEHYAKTVGKRPQDCTLITLHLESGCSACAIRNGESVDTTMGMTPLEGLMMGSRSGSIDPAILPYLMRKEGLAADEVLTLLNKRSGMLGIAGGTLDTRELVKRDDEPARLALQMFGYRVRLAVGAYLALLGDAEAILFGGGIGENSPWLRSAVCDGLAGMGLELDAQVNEEATKGMALISTKASRLQLWSLPVEEGLQIAHECNLQAGHVLV